MYSENKIKQMLAHLQSERDFNTTALAVFYFQYKHNSIYRQWVDFLKCKPADIKSYTDIPFLPISLFKSHKIKSFQGDGELVFSSSGTTGMIPSKHYVKELALYREAYNRSFEYFYGPISEFTVLALLPSYLEREGSSLILMAEDFIARSNYSESGFYLYNYQELYQQLISLRQKGRKVLLLGVSFALLEFAELFKIYFPDLIVMETGGMKGKRKELLRSELHSILKKSFGVEYVHSEYGMTELMSQAYSKGEGLFYAPPWQRVLIRDTNDPLSLLQGQKSGGINCIDLYNLYSCAFIATQDLGRRNKNGSFEILGRFDSAEVRGCNLLVQMD